MRFEIILAPEAVEDIKGLKAHHRRMVRDYLERHLRHEPTKQSKSRVKRLRGVRRPQFRLRVGEFRIYYDVSEKRVEVLAIIPKSQAGAWLESQGE